MQEVMQEVMQERHKLEEGTFFTPIDWVWKPRSEKASRCVGYFDKICREGYFEERPSYKSIVDAACNAAAPAVKDRSQRNDVLDALNDASQKQGASQGPHRKNKKKGKDANQEQAGSQGSNGNNTNNYGRSKKQRKGRSNSATSVSNNSFSTLNSYTDQGSDQLSEFSYLSLQGSNVSNASGQEMPAYTGAKPSSRAHLVSNSHCCYPTGVLGQAVCGEKSGSVAFLRKLGEGMMKSDTNFIRSPGMHGEMFDTKPCWILVPICDMEFLKNWKEREGYTVMVIAGGFNLVGNEVTDANSYSNLCTAPYHGDNGVVTNGFKRSKCDFEDVETARLCDMVMALAETLVLREGEISPLDLLQSPGRGNSTPKGKDKRKELLERARGKIKSEGIKLPEILPHKLDFDNDVQLMKFFIDPDKTDLVPDPMLLLMKAAINWSWRCEQKLLPACGSLNSEGDEEDEEEEVDVPSTPIPSYIELKPVPVTPDSGDDL